MLKQNQVYMPILKWISDDNLMATVHYLLDKAENAKIKSIKEFGKNVVDPFGALFEMAGFHMEYENWIKSETARQAQKTLQNHIGDFHQNILGHCKGWENKKVGSIFDLVSDKNRIIAEVKNKYNTLSGGKLSGLYDSMDSAVMSKTSIYKGYTAYYVAIIPDKPGRYDSEFTPSDREKGEKCASNSKIREIDGSSFYAMVTGYDSALEDLFDVMPHVIAECSEGRYKVSNPEKLKDFFHSAYGK